VREAATGWLTLCAIAAASASEWPSFRGGPANTAWVDLGSLPAPTAEWTFRPSEEIRSYNREAGIYGSPAVVAADGRALLLAGCYDHNVYAIDIASGQERWRYATGGPVFATPCVADLPSGTVAFVGSADRFLYALDVRNGTKRWARQLLRWRASLGRASLASPALFEYRGRPAVLLCSWLYDRSAIDPLEEAAATAYDAETGAPLWQLPLGTSRLTGPTVIRTDGRWLTVVGGADGKVWCIDLDEHEVLWRQVLQGEIVASPAVAPGPDGGQGNGDSGSMRGPLVLIGTRYGKMNALDLRTGRPIWSFRTKHGIDSSAAIAEVDGVLTAFFGSHDQSLYALAAETGDALWRFQTKGDVYSSPAAFRQDGRTRIAFASGDDCLYLLDAATGREVWRTRPGRYLLGYRVIGDSTWSSPVVARLSGHDVLLLPFYDGAIHAYPVRAEPPNREIADPAYGRQMIARAVLIMAATLVLCLWLDRRYGSAVPPDAD
jgi:outer membrane protein assembly factor BamB